MKIVKFGGGLGNQMFQYGLLLALEDHFKELILADISAFKNSKERKFELDTIFDIDLHIASPKDIRKVSYYFDNYSVNRIVKKIFKTKKTEYFEKGFWAFDDAVFDESISRYYIGNWMNVFYFHNIEHKVKKSFQFKLPQDKENQQILAQIEYKNSVSIHVRRGDYLQIAGQLICGLDYYKAAINFIIQSIESPSFYIFSDDIAWCRTNLGPLFGLLDNNFIDWNTGGNSCIDMQLMASCDHNILANSTFSWWGAYLNNNPNKMVIASKVWAEHCRNEAGHVLAAWTLL
jgi:hypothetical protein